MSTQKWSQFAKEHAVKKPEGGTASATTSVGQKRPEPPVVSEERRTNAGSAMFVRKGTKAPPKLVPTDAKTFNWNKEVCCKQKMEGNQNFPPKIPLKNPTNQPMCIAFTGGGVIQSLKINRFGRRKLAVTVASLEEQARLNQTHDSIVELVLKQFQQLYPKDDEETLVVKRLLSEVKAKPDGSLYPQLFSVNFNEEDLVAKKYQNAPDLEVLDEHGNAVTDLSLIPNQLWTYLVVELMSITLSRTDPKDEVNPDKPFVTLTCRARKLYIKNNPDSCHYLFPCDVETHECKSNHHIPIPIAEFSFATHATIGDLVERGAAWSAHMENKVHGNILLKITGGGRLPPFAFGENQQHQPTLTVSVEDPEDVKHLDRITDEFATHTILHRSVYYAKQTFPEEFCRKQFKGLLSLPSEKHPNYARNMTVIFDIKNLGTSLKMIDGNGNEILEPRDDLLLKPWEEIWISVSGLYRQVKGQLCEVGPAKRLVYFKMAPSEYQIDTSSTLPQQQQPAQQQPAAKKQKT